jgi:hypothetical protein
MPSAGGLYQQSAQWIDAVRFAWDEEDYWKTKLIGPMAVML